MRLGELGIDVPRTRRYMTPVVGVPFSPDSASISMEKRDEQQSQREARSQVPVGVRTAMDRRLIDAIRQYLDAAKKAV